MNVEFIAARITEELRKLVAFDRRCFGPGDAFPTSYWRTLIAHWMIVDGVVVGCSAFDPQPDDDTSPPATGMLYISSTAILPKHRRRGYGSLMKSWQIAYAKHHGFRHIVTHVRIRNKAMIALNQRYGFKIVKRIPRYYSDPVESAALMHLQLTPSEH
jgi:ribosomal protein S18 acetylase RimI-like enzyme